MGLGRKGSRTRKVRVSGGTRLDSSRRSDKRLANSFSARTRLVSSVGETRGTRRGRATNTGRCLRAGARSTTSAPRRRRSTRRKGGPSSEKSVPFGIVVLGGSEGGLGRRSGVTKPSSRGGGGVTVFPSRGVRRSTTTTRGVRGRPPIGRLPVRRRTRRAPPTSRVSQFRSRRACRKSRRVFCCRFPSRALLAPPMVVRRTSS